MDSYSGRIAVAGGGGGVCNFCSAPGGAGGGPNGGDGVTHCSGYTYAGYGATSTSAGLACVGVSAGQYEGATDGTLGIGGTGNTGVTGGGGGGGYYGGGGGCAASGGGGSSYVSPHASSSVVYTTGYNNGNGIVMLTMNPAPPVPQSVSFEYTGSVQQWIVPVGVTSIGVDMSGAAGGSTALYTGGEGARVEAILTVTPGSTLYIYVGGMGSLGAIGGYNGGGKYIYANI